MRSAAFSAIMTTGTLVLPETSTGMMLQSTHAQGGRREPKLVVDHGQGIAFDVAHLAGPAGMENRSAGVFANSRRSSSLLTARSGPIFGLHVGRECRVAASLRASLIPATSVLRSFAVDEIIRLHRRRLERVARLDAHVTARFGTQLANRHRETGKRVRGRARHVGRQRRDVKLYVRRDGAGRPPGRRSRPD